MRANLSPLVGGSADRLSAGVDDSGKIRLVASLYHGKGLRGFLLGPDQSFPGLQTLRLR
ncbi:hypothetical protein OAG52_01385 [Verrucomicrobia bacterium]|nr:hypothetical protein [Verrucomicrobiota bacterium]